MKWLNLFSLYHVHNFLRNFNGNGCRNFKCYCKKQINNHFPWFNSSTIDMTSKCSNTLQWNHLPVVLGSTWVLNTLTSLLWSIRVQTIENCCWFVVWTQILTVLHLSISRPRKKKHFQLLLIDVQVMTWLFQAFY